MSLSPSEEDGDDDAEEEMVEATTPEARRRRGAEAAADRGSNDDDDDEDNKIDDFDAAEIGRWKKARCGAAIALFFAIARGGIAVARGRTARVGEESIIAAGGKKKGVCGRKFR